MKVPVIGRDDLVRNKEATGREQDRVDAARLRGCRSRSDRPLDPAAYQLLCGDRFQSGQLCPRFT
jgi:hypothetical protein